MRAACSIDHLARSYQSRRSSLPTSTALPSGTQDSRLMPGQSMHSDQAAVRVIGLCFQIATLFVVTSWCFLFPLATTSPSCVGLVLVWWLICDWQEKTIPGGVTIAVATGY